MWKTNKFLYVHHELKVLMDGGLKTIQALLSHGNIVESSLAKLCVKVPVRLLLVGESSRQ